MEEFFRKSKGSKDLLEPSASVVVPTRGGRFRLPILIEALSKQTTENFETIFVIDGDVDGSAELLASSAVSDLLPNVRVIEFLENRGRSAALNAGHHAANGDILIRCDDDLEPAANYVSAHIERHAQKQQGVIGLYKNQFPSTPYADAYGRDADRLFSEEAFASPLDKQWRYWAGNVSIDREIWREVGEYDLAYKKYGWEDVDYGFRIQKAGYPVVIAPELTTTHHVAAVTTRIRSLRALHSGAAREVFVEIHGEDVLGTRTSQGSWNRLVEIVSTLSTEKSMAMSSSVVDSLLPSLPKYVGKKLVALMVEGAGRAGVKYPARAKSKF